MLNERLNANTISIVSIGTCNNVVEVEMCEFVVFVDFAKEEALVEKDTRVLRHLLVLLFVLVLVEIWSLYAGLTQILRMCLHSYLIHHRMVGKVLIVFLVRDQRVQDLLYVYLVVFVILIHHRMVGKVLIVFLVRDQCVQDLLYIYLVVFVIHVGVEVEMTR